MERFAPRLDIRPPAELLTALDRWRAQQPGIPSRAEAARRLLELALKVEAEGGSGLQQRPAALATADRP